GPLGVGFWTARKRGEMGGLPSRSGLSRLDCEEFPCWAQAGAEASTTVAASPASGRMLRKRDRRQRGTSNLRLTTVRPPPVPISPRARNAHQLRTCADIDEPRPAGRPAPPLVNEARTDMVNEPLTAPLPSSRALGLCYVDLPRRNRSAACPS